MFNPGRTSNVFKFISSVEQDISRVSEANECDILHAQHEK